MAETAEEQRTRILADSTEVSAWEYDLAVDLGYYPEQWDGMWKLTVHPFSVRFGCVVAREVVTVPGTNKGIDAGDNRVKTRLVVHPLPDGWHLVADYRLTQKEPTYRS